MVKRSRGGKRIFISTASTKQFFFIKISLLQHAPGVPKVLVGNRLHLAFKRQVAAKQAELYASRNKMACFEISPLCDFNIRESFCELARMALHRNGMERIWRSNKGNQFFFKVASSSITSKSSLAYIEKSDEPRMEP